MKRKHSIVTNAIIIYLAIIILTIVVVFFISADMTGRNFLQSRSAVYTYMHETLEESIKDYKSYQWIIRFLAEHVDDDLDIEYEANEKTAKKEEDFLSRHEGLVWNEVTEDELEAFSEGDQQIFAEIVYTQWVTEMNKLIDRFDFSYLSFFVYDSNNMEKTYLFSASSDRHKRGQGDDDAYLFAKKRPITVEENKMLQALPSKDFDYIFKKKYLSFYHSFYEEADLQFIETGVVTSKDVYSSLVAEVFKSLSFFVIIQIGVSLLSMLLLYFVIFKPVQYIRKNVNEYRESKNSKKIRNQLDSIKNMNEIGQMASGISKMVGEIDDHIEMIRSITADKERINAQLNVAKQVQAGMLPRTFPPFPERKEFDVYATMNPAKMVGGDFFDFFMTDENHVALVIADVSDKGMPAAMFMAISKVLIKTRALSGGSPAEILYDVNNQLYEDNMAEMFVTVWMVIIDIETGKGMAANAGHEHPVIYRKGGRFELVKYRHSPMLAVRKGLKIREHDFALNPGDRIFVYTDGVPEATNQDGELFGLERMLDSLNKNSDRSIQVMLENMKKEIDSFAGGAEQFDDITMLAFDYRGPEE